MSPSVASLIAAFDALGVAFREAGLATARFYEPLYDRRKSDYARTYRRRVKRRRHRDDKLDVYIMNSAYIPTAERKGTA